MSEVRSFSFLIHISMVLNSVLSFVKVSQITKRGKFDIKQIYIHKIEAKLLKNYEWYKLWNMDFFISYKILLILNGRGKDFG